MGNIDFVGLLFTYQGRINRAQYWSAVVIYVAAMLVVTVFSFIVGFGILFALLAIGLYIPMLISGIMVGIKRLHDRDKSGWCLLVFYLVPALLSWIGGIFDGSFIFSLASFAVSIWALVELGFLPG